MRRLLCSLASALLLAGGLTSGLASGPAPARAAAADAEVLPTCTDDGPRPCLVSATRDGVPLPADDYRMYGRTYTRDDARYVELYALHQGANDLGAADLAATWSATVDLGAIPARVVVGKARNVSVTRTDGDSHLVTVTGRPVTVSGECKKTWKGWRCPEWEPVRDPDNRDREAVFNLRISDADDWAWTGAAQLEAALGIEVLANLRQTAVPAVLAEEATGTSFVRVPLASHRFREDGTLVDGRLTVRLPYSFLRTGYGIDDPASMTGRGLRVAGAGDRARTTLTNDPVGETVLVETARIRFREGGQERRVALRRGVLTPTAPTITSVTRTNERRLVITWDPATARGEAVTGYRIRCVSARTSHVAAATSGAEDDWRKLTGLRLEPYRCQMRAHSGAGPSAWTPLTA